MTEIKNNANEISYQFTAVPTNLFMCLDNNCRSMLFTLIQLSSYYAKECGYFFRTNDDLKAESNLSENVVRATLSALYNNGLIDVQTVGKGKGTIPNNFRVNIEAFAKWEEISIEDCMKNPKYKIETADYKSKGFKAAYVKDNTSIEKDNISTIITPTISKDNPNEVKTIAQSVSPHLSKSEHNIDNTDYEENLENKNNRDYESSVVDTPKHNKESCLCENTKSRAEKFQEYKKQEDDLMAKLYAAKCWTDFLLWRDEILKLMNKYPDEKWNAKTKNRYQKIRSIRMKFFAEKYSKEPYDPVADEVYKETNCGWLGKGNENPKQTVEQNLIDEGLQQTLRLYNTPIEEIAKMVAEDGKLRKKLPLLIQSKLEEFEKSSSNVDDDNLPF